MNQPFYGEQAKPELPVDRVRASIVTLTLSNAQASFTALMAAVHPALHPPLLEDTVVRVGDWSKIEEDIDRGAVAAQRLKIALERFPEDVRPSCVSEARERFTCLRELAGRHRLAQIAGYLSTIGESEVDALVASVGRRDAIEAELALKLGVAASDIKDRMDLLSAPLLAARKLAARFGTSTLEQGLEHETAMRGREAELLERLARLSTFQGRLDVKSMTLGEARALSRVCRRIADKDEKFIQAMREPAIEDRDQIEGIGRRRDKIVDAGRLLDDRFGTAWRLQPIDKLSQAAEIAMAPDDVRYGRVIAYAKSFGIDTKIPQSLDGAAKTIRAVARLKADESLVQGYPTLFNGMDTDVDLLRKASSFVADLRAELRLVRGGDALVTIFRGNSRRVVQEFMAYATLEDDIEAIGAPAEMVIGDVYGAFRADLAELRQDLASIERVREDAGLDLASLLEIDRLSTEFGKADRDLIESRHFVSSGVYTPQEIPDAVTWLGEMTELTGAPPKGDEAMASLLVLARDGLVILGELATAHAAVCRKIGRTDDPELLVIAGAPDFFWSLSALCEVHAARELVCRSEEDAVKSGLAEFVSEMRRSGIPSEAWSEALDERYALLDKLVADDAFARDLSAAASAADAEAGTPGTKEPATPSVPGWVEEDIFRIPAQTEAA